MNIETIVNRLNLGVGVTNSDIVIILREIMKTLNKYEPMFKHYEQSKIRPRTDKSNKEGISGEVDLQRKSN